MAFVPAYQRRMERQCQPQACHADLRSRSHPHRSRGSHFESLDGRPAGGTGRGRASRLVGEHLYSDLRYVSPQRSRVGGGICHSTGHGERHVALQDRGLHPAKHRFVRAHLCGRGIRLSGGVDFRTSAGAEVEAGRNLSRHNSPMQNVRKPISNLRWWIGGLLFASTVINYIDRQTLSLLAPYLKVQYHWTNSDYANLAIAFRVAYSIGQSVFGRFMDRVGTRRGLTLTLIFYSIVSMATSLARGFYSFATFRFLLGAGESANWPAATKAVSEWFPKRERALATALFDSGSSIGGAIAPFLVLAIYFRWGWRPAFAVPGILGFLWLIAWRWLYYAPGEHERITAHELELIEIDKVEAQITKAERIRPRWRDLLKLPQTWGTIVAKTFTDPVFFFITEWFPIYLVAKGIELKSGLIAVWIPFIAADVGSFAAGWFSGYLIRRGISLGWARKVPIIYGGIGMTLLIFTVFTTNL